MKSFATNGVTSCTQTLIHVVAHTHTSTQKHAYMHINKALEKYAEHRKITVFKDSAHRTGRIRRKNKL